MAKVNPPQPVVIPNAVAAAQHPLAPPVPHNAPTVHLHHPRSLGGKFLKDSSSILSLDVTLNSLS